MNLSTSDYLKKAWQFTKLQAKDSNRENNLKPLQLSKLSTAIYSWYCKGGMVATVYSNYSWIG